MRELSDASKSSPAEVIAYWQHEYPGMDVLYQGDESPIFIENKHRNFMDSKMVDVAAPMRPNSDKEINFETKVLQVPSSFPDGYLTAAFCAATTVGKSADESIEFVRQSAK